jgi:hypothetical protein
LAEPVELPLSMALENPLHYLIICPFLFSPFPFFLYSDWSEIRPSWSNLHVSFLLSGIFHM